MVGFVQSDDRVVEVEKHMMATLEDAAKKPTSVRKNIQGLRSERGGEYQNRLFMGRMKSRGIVHKITVSYSPESNGEAGRLNRTLLDMARIKNSKTSL